MDKLNLLSDRSCSKRCRLHLFVVCGLSLSSVCHIRELCLNHSTDSRVNFGRYACDLKHITLDKVPNPREAENFGGEGVNVFQPELVLAYILMVYQRTTPISDFTFYEVTFVFVRLRL